MYDSPRAIFGGARAATQEYCPPATGYMEHISAIGIATASVRRLTPTKLNTMTGGPPDVTPTMKTPLKAVHLIIQHKFPTRNRERNEWNAYDVTMLKLKPIIPKRPKVRLSSALH
jgi:hypothetical protein